MSQRGSCLCGEVAYEVEGEFKGPHHCHCTYCRKSHGTPVATGAMTVGRRWLRGEENVARYESSPGFYRYFCRRCGSVLPPDPSAGFTFIDFGTLDTDPGVRPAFHMFVASKAPWWEIRDGLPKFDGFPPGVATAPFASRPLRDAPGATRGSCLCGAVAFRIEGKPILARSCHCGRCRKARGTGFATNMLVPIDALRFTRGEGELTSYKIPEAKFYTQVFCSTCGAKLPRLDPGRGFAIVPLGSLDDDPGVRLREHIFVGSMAPWDEIHDDLPQFEASAPA